MDDLVDQLKAAWAMLNDDGDEYGLCDTLSEAADALEAAREDACVALVADIRFACGDNGKRMQPELVEFIRELANDAARYRYIRSNESSGSADLCIFRVRWARSGGKTTEYDLLVECEADAAIDQARGKGVRDES